MNYYSNNPALKFQLTHPLMQKIVTLKEQNFAEKDKFDYSDYGEVLKMKEILNTPNFDFNKYKEQAYKLG